MDYNQIAGMATAGIEFFSDGKGEFDCIVQQSSVSIVGGVEVEVPEVVEKIKGFVRSPRTREVDGERILATDKLGVFNNAVELKNGYQVFIDGECYVIKESRPIRQTGTTVAYRPIMRRVATYG